MSFCALFCVLFVYLLSQYLMFSSSENEMLRTDANYIQKIQTASSQPLEIKFLKYEFL